MITKTFFLFDNQRILRTLSLFIILVISVVLLSIIFIGFPKIAMTTDLEITRGFADISELDSNDILTKLNGEWEFYENLCMEESTFDRSLFINPEYVELPIRQFNQSEKKGSYRLIIHTKPGFFPFSLYLPANNPKMNIFINGKNCTPEQKASGINPIKAMVHFQAPIEYTGTIEIVISTDGNTHYTSLFKESVIFGTQQRIGNYTFWSITNSFLIVGMLLIIFVNGYVFMLIMPGHKMISLITLFDSALMFRMLFGMNIFLYFLQFLFPSFLFSDAFFFSLQIFFLMVGGFFGCLLSQYLFDPENIISPKISIFCALLYLTAGIVFSLNPTLFRQIGTPTILCIYVFSFILVFFQFWITLKQRPSGYFYFQIGKTIYIGIVILFDILFLTQNTNILVLSYLYIVFFLAHIFVRLYDNNNSYKDVAKLNTNLEQIVQQRTCELVAANKRLAELSIRDPLTGAYNRLYFEQELEHLLAKRKETDNIHLCMFDLDNFKKINDTYGHDVGDDQLREAVSTVNTALGSNSFLARIGGEEFIILNVGDPSDLVQVEIESIRKNLEKIAKDNPLRTTASFGLVRHMNGTSQKVLLKLADMCLYEAKNAGKNRLVTNFNPG